MSAELGSVLDTPLADEKRNKRRFLQRKCDRTKIRLGSVYPNFHHHLAKCGFETKNRIQFVQHLLAVNAAFCKNYKATQFSSAGSKEINSTIQDTKLFENGSTASVCTNENLEKTSDKQTAHSPEYCIWLSKAVYQKHEHLKLQTGFNNDSVFIKFLFDFYDAYHGQVANLCTTEIPAKCLSTQMFTKCSKDEKVSFPSEEIKTEGNQIKIEANNGLPQPKSLPVTGNVQNQMILETGQPELKHHECCEEASSTNQDESRLLTRTERQQLVHQTIEKRSNTEEENETCPKKKQKVSQTIFSDMQKLESDAVHKRHEGDIKNKKNGDGSHDSNNDDANGSHGNNIGDGSCDNNIDDDNSITDGGQGNHVGGSNTDLDSDDDNDNTDECRNWKVFKISKRISNWMLNLDHARTCVTDSESESSLKCPECTFRTDVTEEFKSHVLSEHSSILAKKKLGICLICCSKVSFTKGELHFTSCRASSYEKFKVELPKMICLVCYVEMEEDDIDDHLYSEHRYMIPGSRMPPFMCVFCSELRMSRKAMKKHYEDEHSGEDKTLCLKCMDVLPVSEVKVHQFLFQNSETCVANKQCQICSKSYMPYQLVDHENKKHTELSEQIKYKCFYKKCSEVFLKRFKLLCHYQETHGHKKSLCLNRRKNLCIVCCRTFFNCSCDAGKRICNICGILVKNACWRGHMSCHQVARQICEVCGVSVRLYSIQYHMKIHERSAERRKCPHCRRKILQHRFAHHVATVHKKKNTYKCTFAGCKKQLSTPYALKVHTMIHTNQEKLKCELCNYGCKQRNALNWHMKSKHKGAGL